MEKNYTEFDKFDISKLIICDGAINTAYNYQSIGILYEYPDGKKSGLRLRLPLLFTYGVQMYRSFSKDYFMSLLSFYNEDNKTPKETEFKKVLDDISNFLRQEAPKKLVKYKQTDKKSFDNLENIVKNGISYSKLKQSKRRDKDNQPISNIIDTIFYKRDENGKPVKIKDPLYLEKKNCRVVVYMDITDIFIGNNRNNVVKVSTSISEVLVYKKDVNPPIRTITSHFDTSSEIAFKSDDEDEEE